MLKFKLAEAFESYDDDNSGELDEGEFSELLKELDADMRSLPPTAQVRSCRLRQLVRRRAGRQRASGQRAARVVGGAAPSCSPAFARGRAGSLTPPSPNLDTAGGRAAGRLPCVAVQRRDGECL